jgi:hypothetical protein
VLRAKHRAMGCCWYGVIRVGGCVLDQIGKKRSMLLNWPGCGIGAGCCSCASSGVGSESDEEGSASVKGCCCRMGSPSTLMAGAEPLDRVL